MLTEVTDVASKVASSVKVPVIYDADTGYGNAINRRQAYRTAGADMAFPEGLLSREEIQQVCEAVPGSILYNRTGVSPNLSAVELQEIGVDLVINPGGAMRAAAQAMWDYYSAFGEEYNGQDERLKAANKGHPLADLHSIFGFGEIREFEAEFLPEEEAAKYNGAAGFQP
jgi:methylisocitrate lyase